MAKKPKPVLGKLLRITAGKHHAYYEATVKGEKIIIRKPIQ